MPDEEGRGDSSPMGPVPLSWGQQQGPSPRVALCLTLTDHPGHPATGDGTGEWWQLLLQVPMGISECHLLPCHGCRGSRGRLAKVPEALAAPRGDKLLPWWLSTSLARLVGLGEVRTSPRHDSGWPGPLLGVKMGKFPNTEGWGKEGALGAGIWRDGRRAGDGRVKLDWGREQGEATVPNPCC